MKINFIHISILICAIHILFGCSKKEEIAELSRHGGNVTIALNSTITDLFPFTTDEYNVEQIHKYMLSPSFVKFDGDGNPLPEIAGIWKTDESNLSVTFILNQNYYWSNGNRVNSYDVQYTLELFRKFPQFNNADVILENIKELTVIDSFNCSISFKNSVAEPLYITNFPILSAENNYDTSNILLFKDSYFKNFIGSGPFLISFYGEDSLSLIKNENYPDRLPYLQRVTFRIYELFDQLQSALQNETIDFIQNLPVETSANPNILKNYNIGTYSEKGYTFIAWNLNSGFLQDKKMRLALSHAIDRQTLIDGILAGYAEKVNGPVYFNKKNEQELLNHPDFDIQKAERLLTEIRWDEFDQQGYRLKNGKRLELTMLVNKENTERIDIAKNIKSNLRSVGVDLKLKFVSWKELLQSIQLKQFDATLVTWTDNDYYDPSLLFHSKEIENGLNFMSYNSSIVDSLIDHALYSWDKNQKANYWRQFREQVVMDLPCTFLFSQKIIVAYNKKIQNVQLDSRGYLANIKEWWIE